MTETVTAAHNATDSTSYVLRVPTIDDAHAVHDLIQSSPPLDVNSVYVYLLLSHHFDQTCVVAQRDNAIVGFVSAYVPPKTPDVLFIWQVAVHDSARGAGLGGRMLRHLLEQPAARNVRYIETTVGPDNAPSRGMFASLARKAGVELNETALFEAHHFGAHSHEDERLLRLGPFKAASGST